MTAMYAASSACDQSACTLLKTWDEYLEEKRISLCVTSICTDYAQARKWLARCPVQDVKEGRAILRWVLSRQPELSARRVAMFIKAMYKWAADPEIGILERNPAATFRLPKKPQRSIEAVVIPADELALVMIALEAKRHHRDVNWALFAEFMLQTGMRTGEVRALKWKDIKNDRVHVHSNFTLTHGQKNSTKTNRERFVPLNSKARDVLLQRDQNSEYIFPWNRYAFQTFFRSRVDELFDAELVAKRYRPYDLRHVAISRWLELGIPVAQVSQWAGNTNEVIWKYYAGSTKEHEMPDL